MIEQSKYLPDDEYEALVAALMATAQPPDLRERVIVALGEIGNMWPVSIMPQD